jgi:CTP synthase (UTP-ammonia lyase)
LSKDNNITTGKIYRDVIEKEVSAGRRYFHARDY